MKKLVFSFLIANTMAVTFPCNIAGQKKIFIDRSAIDTTIHPGDDFYNYANGAWIKKTVKPDETVQTNVDMDSRVDWMLEKIVSKKFPQGSLEQKVGDLYRSYMDTAAINTLSYNPIEPVLKKIAASKNYKDIMAIAAKLCTSGDDKLLGFFVAPDDKKSNLNIAGFSAGGRTFFDNGSYTRNDSSAIRLRDALVKMATNFFQLIGDDPEKAMVKASMVLQLESKIAEMLIEASKQSGSTSSYNKISVADAEKLAPLIEWRKLFSIMGIHTGSINITQPSYFKILNKLLESEPLDVWKAKLQFDYIYRTAFSLSRNFIDAKGAYIWVMRGAQQGPRVGSAGWVTNNALKGLVGELYVKEFVTPVMKKRVDSMVINIQKAFATRIQRLDWMSDSTKDLALQKLYAIRKNIGYPDKWKNYDDVIVSSKNYFLNVQGIAKHDYREIVTKIGKPVDKTQWALPLTVIGGVYRNTFNSIDIPAALFQYPYFDLNADDAINYGAIAAIIGHEIIHGFDDNGRKYDADGNFRNWWQLSDAENFKTQTAKLIQQFNQYTVVDTIHLNGKLTMNENLADLGGIILAYDAFKMTKQGQGNEFIDGLTPDQRFFLSFARENRTMATPISISSLYTSVHSPVIFRVNAPLSNFEPFYKAFNVSETNKLYRKKEDRVVVW
jgi:putative endopeptidase